MLNVVGTSRRLIVSSSRAAWARHGAPVLRLLRYPAALIRDWLGGEINIRAMSLAYTTLLSLVPLMVFSFAILKGLGARGDLRFILHEFFRPMGGAATQLTESVLQFVSQHARRSAGFDRPGVSGVHRHHHDSEGRGQFQFRMAGRAAAKFRAPFHRISERHDLGAHPARGGARPAGSRGTQPLRAVAAGDRAAGVASWARSGGIVPYAIVAVVFTFMYSFIPNTHVQFRAALIGGVTAGIIWALVGKVFTAVILYSSQMVAVYTGFAIVLTTLIWVYLSWLILLIGAQLAFYLQFPQYLRHGQELIELTGADREQRGAVGHVFDRPRLPAGQGPLEYRAAGCGTRCPGHRAGARAGAPGTPRLARGHRGRTIRSRPRSRRHPPRRHLGCRAQPAAGRKSLEVHPVPRRGRSGERSGSRHAGRLGDPDARASDSAPNP